MRVDRWASERGVQVSDAKWPVSREALSVCDPFSRVALVQVNNNLPRQRRELVVVEEVARLLAEMDNRGLLWRERVTDRAQQLEDRGAVILVNGVCATISPEAERCLGKSAADYIGQPQTELPDWLSDNPRVRVIAIPCQLGHAHVLVFDHAAVFAKAALCANG